MSGENDGQLSELRIRIDEINDELLELLNERVALAERLGEQKTRQGLSLYDPVRESRQIQALMLKNRGPMNNKMLEHVFKEIFRASLSQQEETSRKQALLVLDKASRPSGVAVNGVVVGGGNKPVIIAGPCAVEHEDYLEEVAVVLERLGVKFIRGGAFKPRTSPYTFQGLGMRGVEMLASVAGRHDLRVVTELTDTCLLEAFIRKVDVVQVGARNMFNYDMLKKLGELDKPVLLKRSFAATVEELLLAAEYLLSGGNSNLILCERGIRTFETSTRNTLDLSAVCVVKQATDLPVIVDLSHATGRKDLLIPLGRAALAAGADGLMVEVHPRPESAMSDGSQQMTIEEFKQFMEAVEKYLI